jgi:glycosyltransferase involved in cell wall biosynthesis
MEAIERVRGKHTSSSWHTGSPRYATVTRSAFLEHGKLTGLGTYDEHQESNAGLRALAVSTRQSNSPRTQIVARVTYITFDSVLEGVGASQVLPYAIGAARKGHQIELLSFERGGGVDGDLMGITWHPASFSRGRIGPLHRLLLSTHRVRLAQDRIVHARSDLPALAAIVGGHPRWIWDMRAFWREQRIYLGGISPGSPTDRLFRRIERASAERSSAIICLAEAALPILQARFGPAVAKKAVVIPTAVDTDIFRPRRTPKNSGPLRVLLSGSYNKFYDGPTIAALVRELRRRIPVQASWVGASKQSPWWATLTAELDEAVGPRPFAELPNVVASHDVGMVICQSDGGPALKAAMPTKLAEFLACGRPVIVNAGLGDMDKLVDRYRCGVVLTSRTDNAIQLAADQIIDLLSDPDVSQRARACAEEVFALRTAIARLTNLYERQDALFGSE